MSLPAPWVTAQVLRQITINSKVYPAGAVVRLSSDVSELLAARLQALLLPAGALRRK